MASCIVMPANTRSQTIMAALFFMAAAAIALPSPLAALGIGPSVQGAWGMGRWNRAVVSNGFVGGGFVLDGNTSGQGLLNVRLCLGLGASRDSLNRQYSTPILYSIGANFWSNNYRVTRLQPVTSLAVSAATVIGFGVVRRERLRVWLGPELMLGTVHRGARDLFGISWGGGLALGTSVHLTNRLTLSVSGGLRVTAGYRRTTEKHFIYVTAGDSYVTDIAVSDSHENGWLFGGHLEIAVLIRFSETVAAAGAK